MTLKNVEKNGNQKTNNIQRGEAVDEAVEFKSASLHGLFNLQKNRRTNPLMVLIGINGHNSEMDIDIGAAVLLMSHAAFENLWCEADKPKLWTLSQINELHRRKHHTMW